MGSAIGTWDEGEELEELGPRRRGAKSLGGLT